MSKKKRSAETKARVRKVIARHNETGELWRVIDVSMSRKRIKLARVFMSESRSIRGLNSESREPTTITFNRDYTIVEGGRR